MRLKNKVAIITGAASGIGQATAKLFAKEGAKVVIADVNDDGGNATAADITSKGKKALFVHTDVTVQKEVENAVKATVSNFGKLNVLVNCAGGVVDGDELFLSNLDEEAWDRGIALNLKSVFLCSKAAIPEMVKSGGGSVINISSVNGFGGYGIIAYTAAKGGVISLTREIAMRYREKGIRCNVICPGTIETPAVKPRLNAFPKWNEKVRSLYPRGELGKPEDVANLVLYLASDESSFMTGSVLVIDCGLSVSVDFGMDEVKKYLEDK